MCGLAGYLNLTQQGFNVSDQLLECMQKKLEHRGPDAYATWKSDEHQLGLVFRRLRIIDLSDAGMQPMFDREKTVAICFNGEIYNHLELRAELELLGYRYFSQSDTETLLYAYKAWGIDFVHKIDGMFAIALFDLQKNKLFLIRDRMGVKPLYFSFQGGILSFASEIKALWELPWMKQATSQQGLYHYLTFMVTPAPYTIFDQVYKLPAGFYMQIDENKNSSFVEWYSPVTALSVQEKKQLDSEDFCLETIEQLLITSTKKRMMSDVPVGAFLSGGVDSSVNVALMSQFVDRVKTFTIAFSDGPEFDELRFARMVAQEFNTEHHEVIISEREAFAFYESMVYSLDEPLADSVCIPFYFVAQCAKKAGVTVAQVGEGADELFFGYPVYARYKKFYDYFWQPTQKFMPAVIRRASSHVLGGLWRDNHTRGEVVNNWSKQRNLFWGGAIAFNELQKHAVLKQDFFLAQPTHDSIVEKIYPGLRQELDSFAIVDYHMAQLKERNPEADFCQQMLYLELKQRLPELLLMRADKMSMAASVEAREPFLDYKLVEFMFHVPAHLRFKNGVTKYLLKKIAQKWLPDEIVHRQKVGFAAPTVRWFEQDAQFANYFSRLQKNSPAAQNPFRQDKQFLRNNHDYSASVQQWAMQQFLALNRVNK